MTARLEHDPVVAEYRAFFALFAWSLVDDWQAQHSVRARPAHQISASLKAFLIRQKEGFASTPELRHFLLIHPLLVIELGFQLVLDPSAPYGFAVEATLPCRYWFTHKLAHVDPHLLQARLAATVQALQAEIPGLGGTVAFDVKHLYAWVRENTPQVYVKGSFNVSYICKGDPDCRLGVKKSSKQASDDTSDHQPADASKTRTHQEQAHGSKTKSTKKKQVSLFGYGTGVAACTDPVSGDSVLAECTLPRERSRCDLFSSPLRPHAGGPQAVSPLYCR